MTRADVRDDLDGLPRHWSGGAYRWNGNARGDGPPYAIFPPRFAVAACVKPNRVFEFGALVGYCLATLLLGARAGGTEPVVGWCDDESYGPGTNGDCADNLDSLNATVELVVERREHAVRFGQADLVSVDGDHSYEGCVADLCVALAMRPRVILVDDHIPEHDAVRRALADVAAARGLAAIRVATVNGLAIASPYRLVVDEVARALAAWQPEALH